MTNEVKSLEERILELMQYESAVPFLNWRNDDFAAEYGGEKSHKISELIGALIADRQRLIERNEKLKEALKVSKSALRHCASIYRTPEVAANLDVAGNAMNVIDYILNSKDGE